MDDSVKLYLQLLKKAKTSTNDLIGTWSRVLAVAPEIERREILKIIETLSVHDNISFEKLNKVLERN